jgi:hypothetical protein
VYLHTGAAAVALAEMTKDSDLALDPGRLASSPLIEEAMTRAGFTPDPIARQPGAWLSPGGIPVDLMVPEALSGARSRRSARIPPHAPHVARRAVGLEAAVVDHAPMIIRALDVNDHRTFTAEVAGPAAILVAKLHKLAERRDATNRLQDKDAHDVYRLLIAVPTADLATPMTGLMLNPLSGPVTAAALIYLDDLFAAGARALGSTMAGRAEQGIGEPDTVSASAAALAGDLLTLVHGPRH